MNSDCIGGGRGGPTGSMSTWFRNMRTGSFRSGLRIKPIRWQEELSQESLSSGGEGGEGGGCVIRNANAAVRHSLHRTTQHNMQNADDTAKQHGGSPAQCPVHPAAADPAAADPAAADPAAAVLPPPYFCSHCAEFACHVCLEDNTHLGHGLRLLREAAEEQQRGLQERLDGLARHLDAMQTCCDQMEVFEATYADTQRAIRLTTQQLIERLREHEERLLKEAVDIHDATYRQFGASRQELQQNLLTLEILRSRVQSVVDDKAYAKEAPADFLQCHKKVTEKLTTFENLFPHGNFKIPSMGFRSIRCNTAFGLLETTNQERALFRMPPASPGQHVKSASLPPSPQSLNGKKRVASVQMDQPNKVRLHASTGSNARSPPLTASEFSQMIHVNEPYTPPHTYSLPPTPPALKECRYQLPSKTRNRSLEHKASVRCQWKISGEGSAPGEIKCPSDVAFLFDGSVVIADRDNARLQIFDGQGNFVKTIGSLRFKPRRLSVLKNGNIAVTDAAENCVKVFDMSGACVTSWGKKWYKSVFKSPCGIAVNSAQQLIVSDMERHTLSVFSVEGKLIRHLQSDGPADIHSPAYLACDSSDRLIVADNWQQCVKVFDDCARISFQFHRTSGPGEDACLEYPNGVCTDANGDIYVADWGTHCVSKFTRDGDFVEHVLTREDGLYHPAGVAVSGSSIAVTAYCDSQSSVALYDI